MHDLDTVMTEQKLPMNPENQNEIFLEACNFRVFHRAGPSFLLLTRQKTQGKELAGSLPGWLSKTEGG